MGDEDKVVPLFGRGKPGEKSAPKPRLAVDNPPATRTEAFFDESLEDEMLTDEEMDTPEFERDAYFCLIAGSDKMIEFNQKGAELVEFVESVFRYRGFKQESLVLREATFADYSLEKLCDILLSSDEIKWRSNPPWYGAVLQEGRIRQKKITASLRKRGMGE